MNNSKKKKPADDSGFCVYIGPNIIGTVHHGRVIRGNKQAALKELAYAIERYPLIASLIVTDKALPEARIKIKTPGNLLYENYNRLAGRK